MVMKLAMPSTGESFLVSGLQTYLPHSFKKAPQKCNTSLLLIEVNDISFLWELYRRKYHRKRCGEVSCCVQDSQMDRI